jgi:uncharacterized protein (TIGR02266 family)
MSLSPAPDRRASHRFPVELEAHYLSASMSMAGVISNLSRTGVFMRSEFLDDEGSRITLHIVLGKSPDRLAVDGEVVRVDARPTRSGMGIRFTDLSAASRQKLANFVIKEGSEAPC